MQNQKWQVKRNNTLVAQEDPLYDLNIKTSSKHLEWLLECWVGIQKDITMFDKLDEECFKGWSREIILKYLGDKLVLVSGIDTNIRNKWGYGWSPTHYRNGNLYHDSGSRVTWIRCYDLPLTTWSKDDETNLLTNLQYAWVLVNTSSLQHIVKNLKVKF